MLSLRDTKDKMECFLSESLVNFFSILAFSSSIFKADTLDMVKQNFDLQYNAKIIFDLLFKKHDENTKESLLSFFLVARF